ncbi:IS30 family transposase [Tunturiibacter gelidiferens]|uniref:IS30 family transposase n=1 Tax=Tunturiibacter gelidiferens TaxID=3069689 RepID=UPI003D9B83D7
MVEGKLSQEREHAHVSRNHLPQLIHPGPWSAEKELVQHLRSKRLIRRSRHSRADGKSQGQIVDAISIRERPAEVEDRAVPGHWEGDLLAGSKNTHIATLVERHSRFVMLIKVPSKDTETVVAALSRHVLKLPATLRRSLIGKTGRHG